MILIYIIQSYSKISFHKGKLKLQNIYNTIELNNIEEVITWWSYDFGRETIVMSGNGTEGKSRPHINKMNVYVKFKTGNKVAYIYELIHMSEKFPNNHQYKLNENIDKDLLVKVWDIDNCLNKLNLKPTSSRTLST